MIELVHIVLSFRPKKSKFPTLPNKIQKDGNLSGMTNIFRNNFWSVFSDVYEFNFTNFNVRYLDAEGLVNRILLLRGGKELLGETEEDTYVVYFCVQLKKSVGDNYFRERFRSQRINQEKRLALLQTLPCSEFVDLLDTTFIGNSSWTSPQYPPDRLYDIPFISSFYHYAWILLLRIERNQTALDISPKYRTLHSSSHKIILQRLRLINVERFFLTNDRTNSKFFQELCTRLVKKYKLKQRVERANAIHNSFEHHMDNTLKFLQAKKTLSLANMVLILTVFSIPLAVMTMLFSLDLSSSVYGSWYEILQSNITYVIFVLGALTIAIPASILKFIDYMRSRN